MGSHTSARRPGVGAAVEAVLGGVEVEQPESGDPPYTKSCAAYGHEPACATWLAHLQRVDAERLAAGGEAQLKAQCGYWARFDAGMRR